MLIATFLGRSRNWTGLHARVFGFGLGVGDGGLIAVGGAFGAVVAGTAVPGTGYAGAGGSSRGSDVGDGGGE